MPTPHILLLSEKLLINEIPSSLDHSKPPSIPNQCVCVRERNVGGGGLHSYRHVSPQRGNSTKEKSISAGQRPPCRLGDSSNPRILMRHPFKGLWTLEKAPHTVLLSPPPSNPLHGSPSPTPNQHASEESLATSSSVHSAWAMESPTSPQRPVMNYESSTRRILWCIISLVHFQNFLGRKKTKLQPQFGGFKEFFVSQTKDTIKKKTT